MSRPAWSDYIHRLREAEFDIAFRGVPALAFERALEIGAGDGFQSRLLERLAPFVVCTEYHAGRLERSVNERVAVCVCDAETLGSVFAPRSFDLVFSSNVLEHLPDLDAALEGMHAVLRDDGIMVHAVPSRFMKTMFLLLHPVDVFAHAGRRLLRGRREKPPGAGRKPGNNPKLRRPPRSRLRRLLWPPPHGASSGHAAEFVDWGRRRWRRRFERAGFEVLRCLPGPVASGYGFGWDRCRVRLESWGFASVHVFVVKKAGFESPATRHWRPAR